MDELRIERRLAIVAAPNLLLHSSLDWARHALVGSTRSKHLILRPGSLT